MKGHVELSKMAAELEARKMNAAGVKAFVDFRIGNPHAPAPKRDEPAIFTEESVVAWQSEREAFVGSGGEPGKFPTLQPTVSFRNWRYNPRCPKCFVRRVDVVVPDDPKMLETGDPGEWEASCSISGCGWNGTNDDLVRRCLSCGVDRDAVHDGECRLCRELRTAGSPFDGFELSALLESRRWSGVEGDFYARRYVMIREFEYEGDSGEVLVAKYEGDSDPLDLIEFAKSNPDLEAIRERLTSIEDGVAREVGESIAADGYAPGATK